MSRPNRLINRKATHGIRISGKEIIEDTDPAKCIASIKKGVGGNMAESLNVESVPQ
jgi:hypothetical protein